MKAVLTIAGSDSSGGAGIQADLKTIAAHGLFGMSAITALTAQNTTGVFGVEDVAPRFVAQQIDVVFDDIRPDAVKIGMVSSPEIVEAIADALRRNEAENVVVDPVMVATSGSALIANEAVSALVDLLFPLAHVVTPNLAETQALSGVDIADAYAAEKAARLIGKTCGGAVLVKGGHGLAAPRHAEDAEAEAGAGRGVERDAACNAEAGVADGVSGAGARGCPGASKAADDLLMLPDGTLAWLCGMRVDTSNTHGTGCTLSSAIACGLACGLDVLEATRRAKAYVAGALGAGLDLGHGSGPLDHMWNHR